MLDNIHSDHTATQDVFGSNDIMVLYGFDGEGQLPSEDEDYQVSVPTVAVTLSDIHTQQLHRECPPLHEDGNGGISQYMTCINLLQSLLDS
jgi:hypothetical protein